ncbi:ABC transporter ATP-binding protein [Tepidanaerobacter syntrophicus]|uniref:ABC transporter ATP-binding protein n=1 Tax=Tepidanaerobacter syntrophicus TaxID=224999 RepID=UPI0017551B71|nr:ABC transporter ATP-binding protein [Tepidanaerobacter syntrophicus]GLI51850.1 ABC transporter ATP-binding protein [Tepidanaerobacter syntrophicus]HHV83065.1 ABC transporter ATP-binding protein [Tepidanaerobacter syntrophicus]
MLDVKNLNVFYGKIHALKDVSFDVSEGKIVTIVGANGAGKSTLMWTLSGVLKAKSGTITYKDKPLPNKAHEVAARGMILVPERRRLYANLTVKENLMMGAFLRNDTEGIRKDVEFMYDLFPILKERTNQYAGTLSGGEQQMLAIARGLMSKPKILLLDEPSLGLSPLYTSEVFKTILQVKEQGTTILLAEQNAKKALEIADYAYVLETGRIVLSGTGKELLSNPAVQEAYLGVKHKAI